jgi:photosystem II stability/assembly factor-like uncharacterized protein
MKNLLLFVSILFSVIYGDSQWMQANGPGGANIELLAKSSSAIFAATERHGVFRSTDNGESWSSIHITGLQVDQITAMATSDSTVFAVVDGGSIFRSTDNGISWVKACDSIGENILIRSLKAYRNDLFALSLYKGVFRSSDNGVSWIAINNGFDSIYTITSIAMVGDTIFAGGSKYVANGLKHGVFRSLDNGTSWSPFDSGFPDVTSIYRLTVSCSRVIAITNTGFYISSDSSGNWAVFNPNFSETGTPTVSPVYADNTFMYAEGDLLIAHIKDSATKVFLSTDKGSNWSTIGSTLPMNLMKDCMVNKNVIFIGTTHCGIFRSTDNGQTWVSANTGINGIQISSFVDTGKSIFAATYGAGVFVSVDNGMNWSEFNSGLTSKDISSLVLKNEFIYAFNPGDGIFRSSVNENNWVKVNSNLPTNNMWHLAVHDGKLFSFSDKGLYISTDNGVNWILVNESPAGTNAIVTFATCDSTLFAGGTTGLFYYNSKSNTLSKVSSGPANEVINCLASNGNLIFAGTATNGCYISTDKGRNWQKSSLPYKVRPNSSPLGYDVAPVTSISLNGKVAVASLPGPDMFVPNGGSYFSIDSGKSWTPLGPDTSLHTSIMKLLIRGDTLLAGTHDKSIWMRTLPKVSKTVIDPSNPEKNRMLPSILQVSMRANTGLTITYTLPKSTGVSITIHTLNGNRVASIVRARQSAGSYHFNWNYGKTSGLYVVCLKTDDRILSRAVILIP